MRKALQWLLGSFIIIAGIAAYDRYRYWDAWDTRLYTPTYVTKLGEDYFIVDCWHHRILFNRHFDNDLKTWKTLDDTLNAPHSIDWDGTYYVADDTNGNSLRVYKKTGETFSLVNTLHGIGHRPHRVRFDKAAQQFEVLGSESQDFFIFSLTPQGESRNEKRIALDFLNKNYTRSFTPHDGFIYFLCGNGIIYETILHNGSIAVRRSYAVPQQVRGLNDLWFGKENLYITASPRAIIEADSLDGMSHGRYQNVYTQYRFEGTPYYISEIDGNMFIPEITEYSSIRAFRPKADGTLEPEARFFDFGPPEAADFQRVESHAR